ncbi:hypothetical protein HER31_06270 [Ferrimonas lipolytica]|uniref:Transposase n=1 Tax=Ferrimonas lipolytica TaxID=2724191 RepID=A0A6H1UBR5_9GAMM|nr:hypothetical protein HER31_06270 [Ferrimonas lipolytica]
MLTEAENDLGFGLCCDYLRNVKVNQWNHKHVYPIYCELALNLGIYPKAKLKRNVPEPLKEPVRANQLWSVGCIHDQLANGCSYRLFYIIDDFRREGLASEAWF